MTQQWNTPQPGVLGSLAFEQYKNGNLDKARQTVDQALTLNGRNAGLAHP